MTRMFKDAQAIKPFLFAPFLIVVSATVCLAQGTPEKSEFELAPTTIDGRLSESGQRQESLSKSQKYSLVKKWYDWKRDLDRKYGVQLSIGHTSLWQKVDWGFPGTKKFGSAGALSIGLKWSLRNHNSRWPIIVLIGSSHRHNYSNIAPALLQKSIGNFFGTVNGFSQRPWRLNDFAVRVGTKKNGVVLQVGRFNPEEVYNISLYSNPATTFLATPLIGSPTFPFPGYAWGASMLIYPTDNTYILAGIHDANGNIYNFGEKNNGEFFKAIEFGYKPNYKMPFEGRHSVTFWHMDARKALSRSSGWGAALKLEQDLVASGNIVGVLKASKSFGSASLIRSHAAGQLIFKNIFNKKNDMIGVGASWVNPRTMSLKNEQIYEAFYRYTINSFSSASIGLQLIRNPALNNQKSAITVGSFRLRTLF